MVQSMMPQDDHEDRGGMTGLAGIADEDFKAAGESSAPTTESEPEINGDKSFDSDEMLDDPSTIDVVGEKKDVSHEPGKVTKEIIEVGDAVSRTFLIKFLFWCSLEKARGSPCLAGSVKLSISRTSTTKLCSTRVHSAVKAL